VAELTQRQVDVILQDVKGLARYLTASEEERNQHMSEIVGHLQQVEVVVSRVEDITQQMKKSQDLQISKQQQSSDLKTIRQTLGLSEGEPWQDQQRNLTQSRVQGTGRWLLDRNPVFTHWADVHSRSSKTILMSGGSGYGKSFITSHVISHLVDRYLKTASPVRVSVAYYFFSDAPDESMKRFLASIIYQFAAADAFYASAVVAACNTAGEIAKVEDLWQRLILDLEGSMRSIEYFICIDGLSSGSSEDSQYRNLVNMIEHEGCPISFRWFISGQTQATRSIDLQSQHSQPEVRLGIKKAPSTLLISLETRTAPQEDGALINEEDVVAVARHELALLCQKKPELEGIFASFEFDVAKKLATAVSGHFENLESKITQLGSCDSEAAVVAVLDRATDNLEQSLRAEVDALAASLTNNEIRQLNALLLWVVGAYEPDRRYGPDQIELLSAFLYFSFGDKYMIRSLVETKFSPVLTFSETGALKLRSETLLNILQDDAITKRQVATSTSTSSLLHPSEIDIVERVLRQTCGDALYARFGFESFFNTKRGQDTAIIRALTKVQASMAVLLHSLTVLCSRQDEVALRPMRHYAAIHFYRHLADLDLLDADKDTLRELGSKLGCLLCEDTPMLFWWHERYLAKLDQDIVKAIRDWDGLNRDTDDDRYLDALHRTLQNPYVIVGYRSNESQFAFINTALADSDDKYHLLRNAAKATAKILFGGSQSAGWHLIISYKLMEKVCC
jgi:hypothetical protein